jgi:hypothetical protein
MVTEAGMDMKADDRQQARNGQRTEAATAAAAHIASAYARAIEGRDPTLLISLYREDCEHVLINRNAPPSRPVVLRGRAAVAAMWEEDCGRDMTHRVESIITTGDRLAFYMTCQYPDGTRVASMGSAELADGGILRETTIECWDE